MAALYWPRLHSQPGSAVDFDSLKSFFNINAAYIGHPFLKEAINCQKNPPHLCSCSINRMHARRLKAKLAAAGCGYMSLLVIKRNAVEKKVN